MDPELALNVPWEENAGREEQQSASLPDENDMLLCHFSDEELIGLTALQGEELFNKEGIPIFPYLDKIATDPEIRDGILKLFTEYKSNPQIEEEINELGHTARGLVPYPNKSGAEEKNPVLAGIEDLGIEGDDRVAYIPQSFVELLLELNDNKPVLNPDDGLLMFGIDSVKNFIEYGFPVIGLDNLHGSSPNKAQSSPEIFANQVGRMDPLPMQNAQSGQNTGSSAQKDQLAELMQQMAMMQNAQNKPQGQELMQQNMPQRSAQPMGGMQGMMPNAISSIGNAYTAYQADKKKWKQKHFLDQEVSRQYRQHRDDIVGRRDAPFRDNFTFQDAVNPKLVQTMDSLKPQQANPYNQQQSPQLFNHGGMVKNFHDRGLIQGPGKGQDDTVVTQIKPHSYIIDATTTSMSGDGSTDAGANVWRRFVNEIRTHKKPDMHHKNQHMAPKNNQLVDVRLSNGEFYIEPEDVAALGNGSLDKGSKILDTIRKNLLSDKAKHGGNVPSKAKNLWNYTKGK